LIVTIRCCYDFTEESFVMAITARNRISIIGFVSKYDHGRKKRGEGSLVKRKKKIANVCLFIIIQWLLFQYELSGYRSSFDGSSLDCIKNDSYSNACEPSELCPNLSILDRRSTSSNATQLAKLKKNAMTKYSFIDNWFILFVELILI
jgi:hypothetical protein